MVGLRIILMPGRSVYYHPDHENIEFVSVDIYLHTFVLLLLHLIIIILKIIVMIIIIRLLKIRRNIFLTHYTKLRKLDRLCSQFLMQICKIHRTNAIQSDWKKSWLKGFKSSEVICIGSYCFLFVTSARPLSLARME